MGVEVPQEVLAREDGWSVGVALRGNWKDQVSPSLTLGSLDVLS